MDKQNTEKQPSEVLQDFLNYIDWIRSEYERAYEAAGQEDKRLQDLLHELEFAEDRDVRNKVATKFQKSRRERRRQKDIAQSMELLVNFFNNQSNKAVFNKMRQLIGNQRKREEYLNGERHYHKRVEEK